MPERNQIIDDLRGICMLGVIGIHVGSFVLEAPYPNSFLYMLLEILSRYSVPAFFFISGYGLFCQYRPETTIAYLPFLKKTAAKCRTSLCYLVTVLSALLFCCYARMYKLAASKYPFPALLWFSLLPLIFYGLYCYGFYFTFPFMVINLFSFFQKQQS